ncbi:MAG: hypothetical protein IKU22_01015 [Alistipes sp.]|nr:hypothetical protein [Alistipes sp.]
MAKGKKTGGRQAGTPNKASAAVRGAIAKMLDDYFTSETFVNDIAELEPKDRVAAMEKFAAYVSPKLQTTTLDMTVENKKTIEDKLAELSDDEE